MPSNILNVSQDMDFRPQADFSSRLPRLLKRLIGDKNPSRFKPQPLGFQLVDVVDVVGSVDVAPKTWAMAIRLHKTLGESQFS